MSKLCECNCGEPAPIANQTDKKRGWIKGAPIRFKKGHNTRLRTGPDAANWRGGTKLDGSGYRYVYAPDHPHAYCGRYVYEHRLVVERALGRYLSTEEHVHHINGDKLDNRPENLRVMPQEEHMRLHMRERNAA